MIYLNLLLISKFTFSDSIKRKIYAKTLNGKKIDILDPFIQSNAGQIKFIEDTVEALKSPKIVNRLFPFKYHLTHNGLEKKFGNWRDDVVEFLNDWIYNGWHHKKKHLCLFGQSNAGKSTFCNALLGNYEHQNFPIGLNDSKFAFDRWNSSLYTHCIVHEFDFSKFDINTWKIALEGLPFKINKKHRTGTDGAIQVPIIFICNERPKAFENPAILNRIKFVECSAIDEEKIISIEDFIYVDVYFSEHKLTPNVKRFFPIGSLTFPVSSYNSEPVEKKENLKRSFSFESDSGFSSTSFCSKNNTAGI